MNQQEQEQFFQLYRIHRFEHQLDFYTSRHREFTHAQDQALFCSIGLFFLATVASSLETLSIPWLKVVCLFVAAICPILSTSLAGYSALYDFEQQAKIYEDARDNLERIGARLPGTLQVVEQTQSPSQLHEYVQDVETIFRTEQGYWGQVISHAVQP